MAKKKVELTDEQKLNNARILRRIEAERQGLFVETRALQQMWKQNASRRRNGGIGDDD